jgi:predicted dehydrogenase
MISVGLIGTSWWSDVMFLPALKEHPDGKIVAICGRNRERAQEMADKWGIPHVFTDYHALIERGLVQALIISTPNDLHYPITMKALEAGLHVLCEKPLAMNYGEAKRMADLAAQKGVRHSVPFTWSYMPTFRYVKELIGGGYIGMPHYLNMRWYNDFWRGKDYMWRMDKAQAGSGVVSDLGSHYVYMASLLFGEIASVSCKLDCAGEHPAADGKGQPFQIGDDMATLLVDFANGAHGSIHVSGMAQKELPQQMECYGTDGMLSSLISFDDAGQHVYGLRAGAEAMQELPIPDTLWNGARHDNLFETLQDVFYQQDIMTRHFVSSIAANRPCMPNFQDGATVQRVIDAALKSHQERRWVDVAEIRAET